MINAFKYADVMINVDKYTDSMFNIENFKYITLVAQLV